MSSPQAVSSSATTRLRSSLAFLCSWAVLRVVGPYSLLRNIVRRVGIPPHWIELSLFFLVSLNIAHCAWSLIFSGGQSSVPSRSPAPPKGHNLSTPAHRRLQGVAQRQRPRSSWTPSSSYTSTPISSHSRILNYRVPSTPASPLNQSFTPSPLAAYKGRHSMGPGRPLDTSLLDRLMSEADDD